MTSPNAADPRAVRQLEKASKLAEVQRHEVVSGLMATTPGRAWVLDTLDSCHIFATSFALDAVAMAFSEGERNIGLRLLNDIMRACPQHYLTMMQERNFRDAARSTSQRPSSTDAGGSDNRSEGDAVDRVDNDPDYGYNGPAGEGHDLTGQNYTVR